MPADHRQSQVPGVADIDDGQQEKRAAEDASRKAHEAELRAEAAAKAEKATREDLERRYEQERLHNKQLEEQSKKITNKLP